MQRFLLSSVQIYFKSRGQYHRWLQDSGNKEPGTFQDLRAREVYAGNIYGLNPLQKFILGLKTEQIQLL